jgi:hypothetical protein
MSQVTLLFAVELVERRTPLRQLDSEHYLQQRTPSWKRPGQLHSHRCIFQQMLLLAEKNEPIDGITLAAMLRATDGLERIGGMTYLASLVDGVPQTDDIGPYIRILRRKSEARRLIKVGQHIMRLALEKPDRDDLIPHCQRLFYEGLTPDCLPFAYKGYYPEFRCNVISTRGGEVR